MGECKSIGTETEIPRGWETILLVEDQALVREVTCQILDSAGYVVLEADDAVDAMSIFLRNSGNIHLLLTDVVMPGKTGYVLAEELGALCPEMKIIFMSGYGERVALGMAHQEPRMSHLSKPFSVQALLWKVRDLLDEKNSPTLVKVATRAAGSR